MLSMFPRPQQHLSSAFLPATYSRFGLPLVSSSFSPRSLSCYPFFQPNMHMGQPGPSYQFPKESSHYGPIFSSHHLPAHRYSFGVGVSRSEYRVRRYSRDYRDDRSSEDKPKSATTVQEYESAINQINWELTQNEDEDVGEPSDARNELTKSFVKEITAARKHLKNLRRWEYTQLGRLIGEKDDRRTVGDGSRFFVMNYNILSQHLMNCHSYLYKSCDPRALNHGFRKQLLFSELDEIKPDILCLQEVEEAEYYKVHEPTLFLKGYKGIYKKRTGDKMDGCAIFYKSARFSFVDKLAVELFQPHVPLLNRDNVGLFLKLKANTYGPGRPKIFVVATTHLLFNQKRQDIKLAQIQLLLAELDRFAFCGLDPDGRPKYYPIIFTGDFNLEPTSALIRFMTEGLYKCGGPSTASFNYSPGQVKEFLPPYLGVSDQCQHFKLVLERLQQWQSHRKPYFQLKSVDRSLINVFASAANHPNISQYALQPEDEDAESEPRRNTPIVERSQNKIGSRSVTFSDDVNVDDPDQGGLATSFSDAQAGASASKASTSTSLATTLETKVDEEIQRKTLAKITKFGIPCSFESGELQHGFRFSNVYVPQLDRRDRTDASCTTKQACWTTVDYIFYSKVWNEKYQKQTEGRLQLIRRLGLLDRAECKEMGPIPNLAVSSDHYSLVAEFLIK